MFSEMQRQHQNQQELVFSYREVNTNMNTGMKGFSTITPRATQGPRGKLGSSQDGNSDTKVDYSPIPLHQDNQDYINLGKVEHSEMKYRGKHNK